MEKIRKLEVSFLFPAFLLISTVNVALFSINISTYNFIHLLTQGV